MSASWRRWTIASLLARMPVSMALLGMMLAVEEATGSLGTGSQVVGSMTITAGLVGPAAGRYLDRHEIRLALQWRCAGLGLALLAMAVLVAVRAPTWSFFALAIVAGLCLAGVWGGFRALLVVVIETEQRRHAHFVESLMIEVTYGVGPLLISLVVALANPVAGLVVMASFSFAAAWALSWIDRRPPVHEPRERAPWREGPFAVIYLFGFFLGVAFGSIESNVAARMEQYGLESSSGGIFIGILATSSIIGGVWVSVRPMRSRDPMATASWMFVGFSVMILPSVFAPTAVFFAVALLTSSVFLVPLNGLGGAEVEGRTRAGQRAEAFAYLMAATQMGSGLGVVLNGVLSERIPPRNVPLMAAVLLLVLGVSMGVLRKIVGRQPSAGQQSLLALMGSSGLGGGEAPLARQLLDGGVEVHRHGADTGNGAHLMVDDLDDLGR